MVHLISLRLNRIRTRRIDLRAVNLNYPVGVSSVYGYCPCLSLPLSPFLSGLARGLSAPPWVFAPVCLSGCLGCLFVFSSLPLSASRRPLTFVFGSALVSSLFSRPLNLSLGRTSISLTLSRCVYPGVSRQILILTCSDHVQLSPPVDPCVRELSPPLSGVNRGLWCVPGEDLLPCTPRPLSTWFGRCSVQLSRL